MNKILIGTSGYDHPELKGIFYPSDLSRKNFLEYYSTKFNALEINSTFYGMPTSQRMLSFYERSEGRLKFCVKLNRLLIPVVVEFRHKDWIRESVFEGLNSRNAGIVFCDMPQLKNLPNGFLLQTPFIGKNAYIRLHGRNQNGWYAVTAQNEETHRYDYDYSIEEQKSFLPIIRQARNEGKTVQLYFNNHPKGTGFKNAQEMNKIVLENQHLLCKTL